MPRIWVLLVIGLVVTPTLPVSAASKAKVCKAQCGGLIDTCHSSATALGFGDLARACKASVLKRCKKEGEGTCAAFCGNAAVDGTEQCDGTALGGATCQSLGFASGTLTCAIGCRFDTSGCVAAPARLCGNGVKDPDEDCDGDDLGGLDCASGGLPGGELACKSDCSFDFTGCDFSMRTIGTIANLAGGLSYWEGFNSNNANGFSVGDGAYVPGNSDAFDGFWSVRVDGTVVNPAGPMTFIVGLARLSVTAPPVTISNLQVSQRYTTFQYVPALRMVLSLTNPTGTPVNVVVRATGNFGSDTGTTIAGTSNGDTAATTLDRWIATFDTTPSSTDPGVVTAFGGPGTPGVVPTTVALTGDDFAAEFPVTVPADSTRRLMFFSAVGSGGSNIETSGSLFDDLDEMKQFGLFGSLTAAQQAEIVNWDLTP